MILSGSANSFLLFGPKTVTGHTSVIFAIENAVSYSLKFIKPILKVKSAHTRSEKKRVRVDT